jgi:hypothetical protein
MLKSLLMFLLTGALLAAGLGGAATAASKKAPPRPCGSYTLWATNAATADSFDANGDRFECYEGASADPYVPPGKDDKALPLSLSPYKFYAFGTFGGSTTGVTAVDAAQNRFTALVRTQEDDPDMNGCRELCVENLSYDTNDLFYVDTRNGSRLVTLESFEASLPGADRFSMIYETASSGTSIFSLDLAH